MPTARSRATTRSKRYPSVIFTRWSAKFPGTQRRAAARSDRAAPRPAASGTPAAQPAAAPAAVPATADGTPDAPVTATTGSVPAARAEHAETAPSPETTPAGLPPTVDALSVHDILGTIPALVAVVYGPEHRLAYVNGAYAGVFGPRPAGRTAREALPELDTLGLLPLMDQVLRSGKPRTVKSRKVPGGAGGDRSRDGYYTFTCTPIEVAASGPAPDPEVACVAPHKGVLVFGAEVTDQIESAERLRASESRQREAAVTLQRSLLPQELEQPDDLCVAATYQPGGTDAAVGGDWYDVITLGAGRTALVIGDVMGRGVRAAAVMGQLRTAVRAYARLDLPPHEVLQLLDGLAAEIDASQIATCVYAVHDPNEGRLVYASAGHLPILVRDPDGTVRRAAEPTGPPLGTGGWLHTSGSVPLGPGSSAVLYTDGLVERRDKDIDHGVEALERAFAAPPAHRTSSAAACCARWASPPATTTMSPSWSCSTPNGPATTPSCSTTPRSNSTAASKRPRAPAPSPPGSSPPGASHRSCTTSACWPPANWSPTPSSTAPRPCAFACAARTAG